MYIYSRRGKRFEAKRFARFLACKILVSREMVFEPSRKTAGLIAVTIQRMEGGMDGEACWRVSRRFVRGDSRIFEEKLRFVGGGDYYG